MYPFKGEKIFFDEIFKILVIIFFITLITLIILMKRFEPNFTFKRFI